MHKCPLLVVGVVIFYEPVPELQQCYPETVNIAPGLPFVTVYDVQFGGFQTNNS